MRAVSVMTGSPVLMELPNADADQNVRDLRSAGAMCQVHPQEAAHRVRL